MYQAQFTSQIFHVPFPPYNRNNTDQLQAPTFHVARDPDATGDHSWTLQLVTLAELTPCPSLSDQASATLQSPSCSHILLFYSRPFLLLQLKSLTSSSKSLSDLPKREALWLEHLPHLLVQTWSCSLFSSLPWMSSHHYCAGCGDRPLLPLLLSKSDSIKGYTVHPTSCFLQDNLLIGPQCHCSVHC